MSIEGGRVFCSNCGNPMVAGSATCTRCGASQGTPGTATSASRRSRTVLVLLAVLLGQIGIHRFYSRKTLTGLVMLALTVFAYGMWIHSSGVPRVVRLYPDGHMEFVPEYTYSIIVNLGVVWVWTLADIITAATGKFRDRDGKLISQR